MIKIIASSLIFAFVSFIISSIGVYLKRHGETYTSTLRPPKIIFWIGVADISFLIIMDVVLLLMERWEELLVSIIPIVCFVPLGIWLILYSLNWQKV